MAFLAKTVCTWEKSPWTATTCHGAPRARRCDFCTGKMPTKSGGIERGKREKVEDESGAEGEKGQEGEQGKKMRQALNIFRLDRGQRVQGSNQNPGPSRGLRSRISVPTVGRTQEFNQTEGSIKGK